MKKKKVLRKVEKDDYKVIKEPPKDTTSPLAEIKQHMSESEPKTEQEWEEWLGNLKDLVENLYSSDAPYDLDHFTKWKFWEEFPLGKKIIDMNMDDDKDYIYESFVDITNIGKWRQAKDTQKRLFNEERISINWSKVQEQGRIQQIEDLLRVITAYNHVRNLYDEKKNNWRGIDKKEYTPVIKKATKYFKDLAHKYQSKYNAGRTNEHNYYFTEYRESSLADLPKGTEQIMEDIIDPYRDGMNLSKTLRDKLYLGNFGTVKYTGRGTLGEEYPQFRRIIKDESDFVKREFPEPTK